MATVQSQHRVVLIAPAKDVSSTIIHDAHEDADLRSKSWSAGLKVQQTDGNKSEKPSSSTCSSVHQSNSLPTKRSSIKSDLGEYQVHLDAVNLSQQQQVDSSDRISSAGSNRRLECIEENQLYLEGKNTPTSAPSPVIPTLSAGSGECKSSISVISLHNEMEHDKLLEGKPPIHCNGGTQAPASRQDDPTCAFHQQRRATLASTQNPEVIYIPPSPRHSSKPYPKSSLTYNRSLSLSGEGGKLHGGKGFPTALVGSSYEYLTRPKSQSGCSLNEASRNAAYRGSKLDLDNKNQAKYGSTLSNIGVEYMRATGAMGVRFKQLQKPHNQSQDSLSANESSGEEKEKKNSAAVNSLVNELPLIIPMNRSLPIKPHDQRSSATKNRQVHHHHHARYKLGERKSLAERRRKLADYSCVLALIGLLFMVIEMECTIGKAYEKNEIPSYVVKGLITLTTLCLLCMIGAYHGVEVQLFVVDNCIEDWRITMSWARIGQIVFEMFICAIHPVPGAFYFTWTILDIKEMAWLPRQVSMDVILSLPMFMRLYLIVRVMLLHSKLFTDASSRSIGALNKITFNTRFVLKTLMNIFPGTVLVVFMMTLWIISAWILRACECWHDPLLSNLLNSLYLVAITFLSVGYGDFVPHTTCGRGISVLSGLMGAGCTALVVAVIAKKLELTRAEKHVHNFMIENQLSKKLKDAAANVLRETWLIYKYTKLSKRLNPTRIRAHQRKFLQAIHDLRSVKLKQRKLADQANSLTDFAKTTTIVHDIVLDLRNNQANNDDRLDAMEHTIANLQQQIEALPATIAQTIAERQATVSVSSVPDTSPPRNQHTVRLRHYDINQNSFDSGP